MTASRTDEECREEVRRLAALRGQSKGRAMSPAEFVFWLRGFMQAEPELTPERLATLRGVLEDVNLPGPTLLEPDHAEVRRQAQIRLRQERDAFLRELDAGRHGQVEFMPDQFFAVPPGVTLL